MAGIGVVEPLRTARRKHFRQNEMLPNIGELAEVLIRHEASMARLNGQTRGALGPSEEVAG